MSNRFRPKALFVGGDCDNRVLSTTHNLTTKLTMGVGSGPSYLTVGSGSGLNVGFWFWVPGHDKIQLRSVPANSTMANSITGTKWPEIPRNGISQKNNKLRKVFPQQTV